MLDNINNISDLKQLSIKQLPILCQEIRELLVRVVTEKGGHLASNLGVVELTVALHYVFDENDKIIWDVGHQSYVHKILTGRRNEFEHLREKDGLNGFPDINESQYDAFNTGHSSTSISVALGIATARDLQKENYNVIAVCGDGAMSGGMTYEALNNIGDTKMLVIFNDNGMSIDKSNVAGGISKFKVGKYDASKIRIKKFINNIPLIGKPMWRFASWLKRIFKYGILNTNLYFSSFDLKYVGTVDGHNIKKLVEYLTDIKNNVIRPTILHVVTKKGKGYELAEQNPSKYHGIPAKNAINYNTMATIVGQTLCEMAKKDDRIVAITASMTDGVGLNNFARDYSDRFFDVGIAEEHAVTFAGGLARQGLKPYVCIYSTFLQRSFDQILHDICLQNLPVVFCIDRAGLVGSDGKTHQGLFDLSYLSCLPNMTVFSPCDTAQLNECLILANSINSPVAIRYPKEVKDEFALPFQQRWNNISYTDQSTLIIATGNRMLSNAMAVSRGKNIGVIYATTIKPLDVVTLDNIKAKYIFTLEENVVSGGFGENVSQYLSRYGKTVHILAVNDMFVPQGTIEQQLTMCGLDEESIAKTIDEIIK